MRETGWRPNAGEPTRIRLATPPGCRFHGHGQNLCWRGWYNHEMPALADSDDRPLPGVVELCPTPGLQSPRVLEQLGQFASSLGVARLGVAPVDGQDAARQKLERWVGAGMHGAMHYMEGPRHDPCRLLPGARCVLVAASSYGPRRLEGGPVAGYARAVDYHRALADVMRRLAQHCCDLLGRPLRARVCVDTAPLLERELAASAGVGFIGKSTLCISPGVGTATLLSEVILDVDLPLSQPISNGCGKCRSCLDACPTAAFSGPYVLDARRCISYLTIEQRGPIDRELRPLMGGHVFGCDICQRVCPYNFSRKLPPPSAALPPHEPVTAASALSLLEMTSGDYRRLVKGSALGRASRPQLQRNAAIALGNLRDPLALSPLARAVAQHPHPLVRSHAAWALGRFEDPAAAAALRDALGAETDAAVREEIELALAAHARNRDGSGCETGPSETDSSGG